MTVIEIQGDSDFQTHMRNAGGKLVVVDFSATWCGPCQFIKPTYENYSRQYHDVVFLAVDEAQNRSLIGSLGVRGFPTFHFYVNQRKVDELVGADPNQLRNKIEQWRQSVFNPFASPGVTLGSYGTASLDPREARLRRFNESNNTPAATVAPAAPTPAPMPAPKPTPKPAEGNMVCDPVTGTCRLEPPTASAGDDGSPDVNEEFLKQLMDMGFAEIRSTKALLATENSNVEAAIAWLGEHQEDPDIDEPIKFIDMAKHVKKSLTEEEKAAKLAELQAKIEQRRKEREEKEKQSQIENEVKRRTMGQEMLAAREEYEVIQRKLAADQQKREREEAKKEKERLRKLIEQDKLIRKAHGGKLAGPPVDLPEGASAGGDHQENDNTTTNSTTASNLNPQEQIVDCIGKLRQYRVGDDGLTALKTLMVYVKNILEKPDEDKYRTINLENAAFRRRVGSLVGGIAFLKALGYEKDEQDGNLKLAFEDRNEKLLTFAKNKLDYAIAEMTH